MYLECIVSLVMHITSWSALEMLAMCLFLFCVSTSVLFPCTPMSIVLTPPILLPHYWFSCPTCCLSLPPHLLPIYSPCVCSPVAVRCHMSSGCVLILPFPAQAVKLPVEFFPQGVVFAVCFVFVFITKYNLLLYWVLASSRTPDCCEHVRLK